MDLGAMTTQFIAEPGENGIFKQSFLQQLISIHFPPKNVVTWTASASVSASIVSFSGIGSAISVVVLGFNTDLGPTYKVSDFPDPFAIPLVLPPHLSIGSFVTINIGGTDYWEISDLDVSYSKSQVGTHPSVVVLASFTVQANSHIVINATATGVTSGRPGGDAEKTASASKDINTGFSATVSGNAVAGAVVNAGVAIS